jgi:hypothetical protein
MLLSLVIFAAPAGTGDVKMECIAAAEAAQTERLDGPLLDARRDALVCSRDECPAGIRSDCRALLAEVEGEIPSIVVRAHDGAGRERADVLVSVDGALLARGLNGRPIDVNPGSHRFRFEAPGADPVEESVFVSAGEKGRSIDVTLAMPAVPVPPPSPKAPLALRLALFGVGAAGIAAFGALSIPAHFDAESDRKTCAPRCSASEVDSLRTRLTLGDIGLGVGILGVAAGTWLTLWWPSRPSGDVQVEPLRGGLAGSYTGSF